MGRSHPFSILILSAALLLAGPLGAKPDPKASIDARVEALLAKMTLEEKVGQLIQYAHWGGDKEKMILEKIPQGGIGSLLNAVGAKKTNELQRIAVEKSRLGIPILYGLDVIHGFRTIFPIPLAEACAWDPGLLERSTAVAAHEASAAGVRWTFAPMVDVSREPRWGRICEASGEDPTLGAILAAARVRGFQGKRLDDPGSIAACAKHFVGYGAAEAGREYNTTDMSENALRNIHLPPFKACVEAGVRTLMSAFNDLNGIPTSGNTHTLRDILRKEWSFQGFVVSDWASVAQLVPHGYAEDLKDAALKGQTARVDMDMEGKAYDKHLVGLVREKKVPLALVDDSVRRVLKVKFELGLFDNPYVDEAAEDTAMLTPESRELALESARKAIVLLKNERDLLPLSPQVPSLAVIGPLAESKEDPLGSWNCKGKAEEVVSILEGLKKKLSPKTRLHFSPGVGPEDLDDKSAEKLIRQAVETVKKAKIAIVVAGEREKMSGEAASRTSLSLPGRQLEMLKAIHGTKVPIVLVLMNGRPLALPWESENLPAILEAWFLGTRHGDAVADVLFGEFNPSGKLTVTFPRGLGQIPIYHSAKNTGRPFDPKEKWNSKYIDSPNSPQYPFGFGSSYTSYEYSGLELSSKKIGPKDPLKVTAKILNKGDRAGTEIVQLYIQDVTASLTRPIKQLADFRRLDLEPGESGTAEFTLSPSQLGFWDNDGKYHVEPGKFNLWVGKDSSDETLSGSFELVEK